VNFVERSGSLLLVLVNVINHFLNCVSLDANLLFPFGAVSLADLRGGLQKPRRSQDVLQM